MFHEFVHIKDHDSGLWDLLWSKNGIQFNRFISKTDIIKDIMETRAYNQAAFFASGKGWNDVANDQLVQKDRNVGTVPSQYAKFLDY